MRNKIETYLETTDYNYFNASGICYASYRIEEVSNYIIKTIFSWLGREVVSVFKVGGNLLSLSVFSVSTSTASSGSICAAWQPRLTAFSAPQCLACVWVCTVPQHSVRTGNIQSTHHILLLSFLIQPLYIHWNLSVNVLSFLGKFSF